LDYIALNGGLNNELEGTWFNAAAVLTKPLLRGPEERLGQ
jgi:hypothetical protein